MGQRAYDRICIDQAITADKAVMMKLYSRIKDTSITTFGIILNHGIV